MDLYPKVATLEAVRAAKSFAIAEGPDTSPP